MSEELSRLAEDFGELTSVRLSTFQSGWIETIRLGFAGGSIVVSVDDADDAIRWDLGPEGDLAVEGSPPGWEALLSSRVRWIWELTNHRGYRDGIQIEFTREGNDVGIQMMAEASRLRVYRLEPFPRALG